MFEHVVLRRAAGGLPISVGQIAESMLYYQKAHLFIDHATLIQLIKDNGPAKITTLLSRPEISAAYCAEYLGTRTDQIGVTPRYSFTAFAITGHKDIGEFKTTTARLEYALKTEGVDTSTAKRFVRDFLNKAPVRQLSGNHYVEGGIVAAANRDVIDIGYIRQVIRQGIAAAAPGYTLPEPLDVEVIETDAGFFVFTNLDFTSINEKRAQATPPLEPLTMAALISGILDARADLALASFYGGDFVTSALTSSIIQVRHAELLRRSNLNLDSRRQFLEMVLPNSPSVAEVIDSGERTLDDFFKILDRAAKFKEWLKSANPDENLVRTYLQDVTSENWLQRLPTKTLRYLLTQVLDSTHPLAGAIAGFVDSFIVEKLVSGWRPNHFVSEKLGPFLHVA